jgi:hypothetical protein
LVIGALFLFWFFRIGLANVRTKNTFRRGIAVGAFAGISAILVHSIFDFVLHITAISVMFLMIMAIMVASGRDYDDEIEEFDDVQPRRSRSASVSSFSESHRRRRSSSERSSGS